MIALCKWKIATFPVLGIRCLFLGCAEGKALFWQAAEGQVAQVQVASTTVRNPERPQLTNS